MPFFYLWHLNPFEQVAMSAAEMLCQVGGIISLIMCRFKMSYRRTLWCPRLTLIVDPKPNTSTYCFVHLFCIQSVDASCFVTMKSTVCRRKKQLGTPSVCGIKDWKLNSAHTYKPTVTQQEIQLVINPCHFLNTAAYKISYNTALLQQPLVWICSAALLSTVDWLTEWTHTFYLQVFSVAPLFT